MNVPDELVQAAAEALTERFTNVEHPVSLEETATIALTAAFAKLAECDEAVEVLADVEHERWSKWMRWLYSQGWWNDDGSFTIIAKKAQRWRELAATNYADMDDETKEHDRVEARTSLAAFAKWGQR